MGLVSRTAPEVSSLNQWSSSPVPAMVWSGVRVINSPERAAGLLLATCACLRTFCLRCEEQRRPPSALGPALPLLPTRQQLDGVTCIELADGCPDEYVNHTCQGLVIAVQELVSEPRRLEIQVHQ